MPSRKKAQGKARKAAKAEKRRSNSRQALGAQIQRLQLQDLLSDTDNYDCLHGHTVLPEEDVAHQFITSFVSHYYDALNSDGRLGPKNYEALNATDEMLGYHTLQDIARVDWCLSFLYGVGTQHILDGDER